MSTLWAALEGPIVDAVQLVLGAAALFVAVWLRERAARLAARHGAVRAELEAEHTGARGQDKMDLARTHAGVALGVFAPRAAKLERLIEQEIPAARRTIPPA